MVKLKPMGNWIKKNPKKSVGGFIALILAVLFGPKGGPAPKL